MSCARSAVVTLLFCGVLAQTAGAANQRALLVGINDYNPDLQTRARLRQQTASAAFGRLPGTGDATYWRFDNLDGALNDLQLMKGLLESLGLQETDFVVLRDQQATAAAILAALQKNLVDDAQPGDVRVFYYSGHGNHIRNRASREQGQQDQTIVPADHWNNVPDIRDKEIARILWKAAQKHVSVTFIADSCHSGSLTRGQWNARGRVRTNTGITSDGRARQEPEVDDPGEIDPQTKRPIDPATLGVLTLAAAQPNEEAVEMSTEDGPHGAFTWALAHSIKSARDPMDSIFRRTVAILRANAQAQEPVIGGLGRGDRGIFGDLADPKAGVSAVVQSVNGNEIQLRGGTVEGLYPGCVLRSEAKPPVSVVITTSRGISGSVGRVNGPGKVGTGEVLVLDQWVGPSNSPLRVHIPPAASAVTITRTVEEMTGFRGASDVVWMDDVTAGRPDYVMSWNGSSWILEQNPAKLQPMVLGAAPRAEAVKRLMAPKSKFLLWLPPTTELADAVKLRNRNQPAIQVIDWDRLRGSRPDAQYWFTGRWNGSTIEYAWVLPDAGEADVHEMTGQAIERSKKGYLPLPIGTDWVSLGDSQAEREEAAVKLTRLAERLAKVRAWFTMPSLESQGTFPYHLALRNGTTRQVGLHGDLKVGETYKLYLQADPKDLKRESLAKRWVYIFAINSLGESKLLFPDPDHGNEGNRLPYSEPGDPIAFPALIPIHNDEEPDIRILPPAGIDTYFLLTSEEPIDNPDVLEFAGVRTETSHRDARENTNPLTDLLATIGYQTRGQRLRPIPTHWSIETLTLRSAPKADK